jgi:hypothetical protein
MPPKDPDVQTNTESDRTAIREQLDRILKDPLFLNSKRYPSFLRYVVTQTLEGQTDQLKERTLGMEVFGRDPDYDTNLDNVVRSTAGEIRKRLAQYYQDPQHTQEIRIELPSGSYVPRFHYHVEEPEAALAASVKPRPLPIWMIMAGAVLAVAAALFAWTKFHGPETAMEKFWAPVLDAPGSVLLCTGTVQSLARQMAKVQSAEVSTVPSDTRRHVTLGETTALMKFASWLNLKGKPYRLRDDSSITLADLKDAPVILIGAMNNVWTLRIAAPLQFSIQFDENSNTVWIADREHPTRRNWSKNNAVPPEKIMEDYALISRFQNSTTGQYTIISAGLYRYGTVAAGEFLTDPSLMAELASAAPSGWERQNIQIVIATKVIDGNASRPQIVATHFF